MSTVWVAYSEYGYDGCSEPLHVFATKNLAEIWKVGGEDSYGSAVIKELPVTTGDQALSEEG